MLIPGVRSRYAANHVSLEIAIYGVSLLRIFQRGSFSGDTPHGFGLILLSRPMPIQRPMTYEWGRTKWDHSQHNTYMCNLLLYSQNIFLKRPPLLSGCVLLQLYIIINPISEFFIFYLFFDCFIETICCANYNTRKCTNRLQYSVLQVQGRSHKELCCKN